MASELFGLSLPTLLRPPLPPAQPWLSAGVFAVAGCTPCHKTTPVPTVRVDGFQPSRSSELHHQAEPVLRWDVSILRERSRARTRLSEDQAARSRDRQGGFPARLALGFAVEEDSSSSNRWIWRSSSRQCGPLARLAVRPGEASGAGGVPECRPSSCAPPPVCGLGVPTVSPFPSCPLSMPWFQSSAVHLSFSSVLAFLLLLLYTVPTCSFSQLFCFVLLLFSFSFRFVEAQPFQICS